MLNRLLVTTLLLLAACDEPEYQYDSMQACHDHHVGEGFAPADAVEVCTGDNVDLAGEVQGFDTVDACVAYVRAHLAPASATEAEILAGCTASSS